MKAVLTRVAVLAFIFQAALLFWGVGGLRAEEDAAAYEVPEVEPYIYSVEGKRDPFQIPPGMVGRQGGDDAETEEAKPVRIQEYLERFQLDSLKLVAILFHIEGQESAAMVQDPEGQGHLVRIGNYLGVNEGRITNITDGEVTIVEPSPEEKGKVRTINLQLHEKDG